MALLELTDIEFNYSAKELYKKACMKINLGEHCCLVGANGCGKTTLLNMIIGELTPDAGKVAWTNGVTYSYLDQQLAVKQDMPVEDYLYGVYKDLFQKEKQMESLYEKAAYSEDFEKILSKAQRLQDELEQSEFYSLQEKVGRISDGLGFDRSHLEMPLHELSGGQREKAYIAKMLLEEKDVLIMDEPTNFLDQSQVEWLANYLNEFPNAFLVVSHDQEFLKKIANVVFVLENGTITRYRGDFEHYLIQHEIDKEQYQKNYEAQQRYIKKEEDFIAKHIVRATSAKAAKSHRARLAHLDVMDAPAKEEGAVRFSFPFTSDVGEKPLIVEELSIGYKGKALLDPISFTLLKGEKIAILGQNGVGKTTFLKTVLGIIPQIDGEFRWLDGTVVNYYSQDEHIDLSLTPFELLHDTYPNLNNTQIRTALGNCGVRKDLALRPMSELSGGEVTKTRFALMSLKKANFLVFDEPTNHLDQKAKDALFDAIERYPGAVIIVSHEKDFYDGLVDYELYF